MVLIAGKENIQKHIQKKLLISVSLGIFCIIIPILCLVIDPLLVLAKSKLKIVKGGLIHEVLKMEYKGLHIKIYVFNITNPDRFLSGEDHKLKLQEVGPFVYQEYRKNEDVEIIPERGVFRYTPNTTNVFLPEESVGDPRKVVLNMPNVPLMGLSSLLSTYPFLIKTVYNLVTIQQNAKPIVPMDVHSFLWDLKDPLITAANKLVPGLIYYENIGIFERLYDRNMKYTMEMGGTEKDKFSVKWVDRKMRSNLMPFAAGAESNITYTDTYEGMGYPPDLPTSARRFLYRPGICKTFEIEFAGRLMLDLNTEGHVYDFSNRTFANKKLCDSKGFCPDGFMDLSDCYFGMPVTVSRGHMVGADRKILDRIEGLNPDPALFPNYLHIEPKIGLIIKGRVSLQLNILMRDVNYSSRLRGFTDLPLPLMYVTVDTPALPDLIQTKLELFFLTSYKVQSAVLVVLTAIGLSLLGWAAMQLYAKWATKRQPIVFEKVPNPKGNIEAVLVY